MNIEVRKPVDDVIIVKYGCSEPSCGFECKSREELQDHLDNSAEKPDVNKLLTMNTDSAIQYALRFPNW